MMILLFADFEMVIACCISGAAGSRQQQVINARHEATDD